MSIVKYRKNESLRVLYDLSGRRQEEITQYRGFLEVAEREGWQVVAISEQVETQIRTLCDLEKVDAVVGNFISEIWLSGLPNSIHTLHNGMSPLSSSVSSVTWDMAMVGKRLREHLREQGYESFWVFGPQNQSGLREGLQAEGQFRTSETLRTACSELRNFAVISPTDFGARQAFNVVKRAGMNVPEQIGIAGVGGRTLDAVLSESFLTTVELPYEEKGRQSGELLLALRNGQGKQQLQLSPVRVVSGASTRRAGSDRFLQEKVEVLLRSNLTNPPPVEEWARRSGMSRRGYERAFAAEAECTPYEYLLRYREQEAKRLLTETSLPLYRIGEAVGIPDPPRFSAFFKKRVGVAASVWRRNHNT
jgi:AraC-like DNA-binding protein